MSAAAPGVAFKPTPGPGKDHLCGVWMRLKGTPHLVRHLCSPSQGLASYPVVSSQPSVRVLVRVREGLTVARKVGIVVVDEALLHSIVEHERASFSRQ